MQTHESLKHTTWECKYHVVFIPKCRRKVLYLGIRQELGVVFGSLAEQWECKVEEGHLMPDHVHNRFERFTPSQASGFAGGR
jgi:putative transposase